jgi:hypothetical protein
VKCLDCSVWRLVCDVWSTYGRERFLDDAVIDGSPPLMSGWALSKQKRACKGGCLAVASSSCIIQASSSFHHIDLETVHTYRSALNPKTRPSSVSKWATLPTTSTGSGSAGSQSLSSWDSTSCSQVSPYRLSIAIVCNRSVDAYPIRRYSL